jgi:hypothetical protein
VEYEARTHAMSQNGQQRGDGTNRSASFLKFVRLMNDALRAIFHIQWMILLIHASHLFALMFVIIFEFSK